MKQFPLIPTLTVSQVTRYLRELLQADEVLQDIWVQGEISNFSKPSSGHLYFTLKDAQSAMRCVMWRTQAAYLPFAPRDGMAVEVHGGMNIYEASGQIQLYVDSMRPAGEGALYQEFLRLKARLDAEGLFDAQRKRKLPLYPQKIGIVTSPTGAALQDMLNTLRRRYPLAAVYLSPSPVQGEEAPPGIVLALQRLQQQVQPDVIIVARGGGSIEDLWAFNDERVARAIAASDAPLICGVGHETDFTIADFAADVRAPTPTAAAELATPLRTDLLLDVQEAQNDINRMMLDFLAEHTWQLKEHRLQLKHLSPINFIHSQHQRLDEAAMRLENHVNTQLNARCMRLQNLKGQLAALNPLQVLARGYAILTKAADGSPVVRKSQVGAAEKLNIQLVDGSLQAQIISEETGA